MSASNGSSSQKPNRNIGKTLAKIGGAIVVVLLVLYLILLRPFLSPRPLAEIVPDDTTFLVSIDLANAGKTAYNYISAIGFKRFGELMKPVEETPPTGFNGKMARASWSWITREAMAVGEMGNGKDTNFALLIGSHSAKRAERNMPKIFNAIKENKAVGMQKLDPEGAKKLAEFDFVSKFEKSTYRSVNVYCYKDSGEVKFMPSMCWASTKRAVIIANNKKYAEKLIDSIYDKRTDNQKYLKQVRGNDVPNSYVVYAFVNGPAATEMIKGNKAALPFADDLAAVKGAVYQLSFKGLTPTTSVALLTDDKKLKDNSILKSMLSFEAATHKIDNRFDIDNDLLYFSMNNVQNIFKYLSKGVLKEQMAASGQSAEDKAANEAFDRFMKSLGNEFAIALVDVQKPKDSSGKPKIDFAGAVEIKDKTAALDSLKVMLKSMKIDLDEKGGDIYAIKTPGGQSSYGIAPCFGFSGKYLFFASNEETLKNHMEKMLGRKPTIASTVKFTYNVSKLSRFATSYIDDEKINKFINGMMDVYGPGTIAVAAQPGKLEVSLTQKIFRKPFKEMPLETIKNALVKAPEAAKAAQAQNAAAPLYTIMPASSDMIAAVNTGRLGETAAAFARAAITPSRIIDVVKFVSQSGKNAVKFDDAVKAVFKTNDSESQREAKPKREAPSASDTLNDAFKMFKFAAASSKLVGEWFTKEALFTAKMPADGNGAPLTAIVIGSNSKAASEKNLGMMFEEFNKLDMTGDKRGTTMKVKFGGKETMPKADIYKYQLDGMSGIDETGASVPKPVPFVIAFTNSAVIVSTDSDFAKEIADAQDGATLKDKLSKDIPANALFYSYVSGKMIAAPFEKKGAQQAAPGAEAAPAGMGETAAPAAVTPVTEGSNVEEAPAPAAEAEPAQPEAPAEEAAAAAETASNEPSAEETSGQTETSSEGAVSEEEKAKQEAAKKAAKKEAFMGTISKELPAIESIVFSVAYEELSPTINLSVNLYPDKAMQAPIIGQIIQYQAAKHDIDKLLNVDNAILYLSLNNFNKIVTNLYNGVFTSSTDAKTAQTKEDMKALGLDPATLFSNVGDQVGFALLDLAFNEQTSVYIPTFIGAVQVNDQAAVISTLDKIVALANEMRKRKLAETGGGGDAAAAAPAELAPEEKLVLESVSDNIVAINGPTFASMGEGIKLYIGFARGYMFFSLHKNVLDKFMAADQGKESGAVASLKINTNPMYVRKFVEGLFLGQAKNPGISQAQKTAYENKAAFIIGALDIYGKGSLVLSAAPDKISITVSQKINPQGYVNLPVKSGLDYLNFESKSDNVSACADFLDKVGGPDQIYEYSAETGSYNGINPNGDNIAKYVLPLQCPDGNCPGKLKEIADKVCEPGSFKIAAGITLRSESNVTFPEADESNYLITAMPRGVDMQLCKSVDGTNYNLYSKYLTDAEAGEVYNCAKAY